MRWRVWSYLVRQQRRCQVHECHYPGGEQLRTKDSFSKPCTFTTIHKRDKFCNTYASVGLACRMPHIAKRSALPVHFGRERYAGKIY